MTRCGAACVPALRAQVLFAADNHGLTRVTIRPQVLSKGFRRTC